jgi:hypothetical protein
MGIKDQFTPEQWKSIYNAPFAAATYVASASGDTYQLGREESKVNKLIKKQVQHEGESGYGELVDSILAEMKAMSRKETKALAIKYEGNWIGSWRGTAWVALEAAVKATANLPGQDGFKQWLWDIGKAAAEAYKSGFAGIGGVAVDAQEQTALNDLARLFGLKQS